VVNRGLIGSHAKVVKTEARVAAVLVKKIFHKDDHLVNHQRTTDKSAKIQSFAIQNISIRILFLAKKEKKEKEKKEFQQQKKKRYFDLSKGNTFN
jgi:ribosomal protein L24